MTTSVDQARELLGGKRVNGHDLVAGHADRHGLTLIEAAPRRWQWLQRERRPRRPREPKVRDGSGMISTATWLLFGAMVALLSVSYAAQFRYVLSARHQSWPAAIEAGALDVLLIIFSLLALGLARKKVSAPVERLLVLVCALGSAAMNYAASNVTSPRSVAAYCMPPIALAIVTDRVVASVRRHYKDLDDASPWATAARSLRKLGRFAAFLILYALRLVVDRKNTLSGIRLAIINATPLPQAGPGGALIDRTVIAAKPVSVLHASLKDRAQGKPARTRSSGLTKTARFLALVIERHGPLAAIPLDQASSIATAIAPDANLHPASARNALLNAVRAALPAGGSDSK